MKSNKAIRTRAISVVRGELQYRVRFPHRVSGKDAIVILDDISRCDGEIEEWLRCASEAELDKWVREWDAWARVETAYELCQSPASAVQPATTDAQPGKEGT